MEALGVLTGGLAHDFNNLLTVISGSLGFLAQQRSELPKVRNSWNRRLAGAGGAELIKRLLSFARQRPLVRGDRGPASAGERRAAGAPLDAGQPAGRARLRRAALVVVGRSRRTGKRPCSTC